MRRFVLAVVLLMIAVPAYAGTVTRTVCPSGCDETTLNAAVTWFEVNHSNLTTESNVGEIVIQGDWTGVTDTTAVNLSGVTTNATYYLRIYTTGDARHNGVYGGNAKAYKLEVSGSTALNTNDSMYLRIEGLQVKVSSTTTGHSGISMTAWGTSDIRVYNNIVKGVYTSSGDWGGGIAPYSSDNTAVFRVYNNIIYDFYNTASQTSLSGIFHDGDANAGTTHAWNNTVYGCYNGIRRRTAGTVNSANNGLAANTNAYFGTVSGKTGDSTSTPTFVSEGGDDFHLSSGDTTWKDQTTDQSSGFFTNDIDYQTRTGSWDIGADEVVSAGRIIFMVN